MRLLINSPHLSPLLIKERRNLPILSGVCYTVNMTTITIPKSLAQMGDLVLVPRKEYESFLQFKKIKEYTPTLLEKQALKRAQLNFKKGKTLSFDEFSKKLGFAN